MTANTDFSDPVLSLPDWQLKVRARLAANSGQGGRQLFAELNSHLLDTEKAKIHYEVKREAAVLLLIIDRADHPYILYTIRADDMPSHAGQISFPGGGKKDTDTNSIDTALREASEEISLDPTRIEILGTMNTHFGAQGFAITPVVAVAPADIETHANPREVAEIFEVPLEFILQSDNHVIETREDQGIHYKMYALPYQQYHIWGLTAGITRSFYELLTREQIRP